MKKKFLLALITVSMGMNCITTQAVTIDSKKNISTENKVIQENIDNSVVKENNTEEIKKGIVPVEEWGGISYLIDQVEDITKKTINDVTYEDLKNIEVIYYTGQNGQLPAILKEFINLKELYIEHCTNIGNLPNWVYNLSKLEVISLKWSAVTSLSMDIQKLQNLKVLDLDLTNISSLPAEIKNLTKLEKVNLNTTPFTDAKYIPDEIYDVKSLKDLTFWGQLPYLDDKILKLENLEVLDLQYNSFNSFPETLYDMKNLKKLNLQSNKIKKIEDKIEKINKLEYLNLAANGLVDISNKLYNIQSLKSLEFSNNDIDNISDDIGKLNKLERLGINYNKLIKLPETLKNINGEEALRIYATGNYISKMPELNSNQKIELCFNFISCPHNLLDYPQFFKGYYKLYVKSSALDIQEGANLENVMGNKILEHYLGYKVVSLKSDGEEEITDGGDVNTSMQYELVKESGEIFQINNINTLKPGDYKFKVKIKDADITNDKAITDEYLTIKINQNTDNGNGGNTEQPGNSNTNNNQNANANNSSNNSLSNKGQLPYTGGTDSRNVAGFGVLTTLLGTVLLRKKK